jgi:hypothetical protein
VGNCGPRREVSEAWKSERSLIPVVDLRGRGQSRRYYRSYLSIENIPTTGSADPFPINLVPQAFPLGISEAPLCCFSLQAWCCAEEAGGLLLGPERAPLGAVQWLLVPDGPMATGCIFSS